MRKAIGKLVVPSLDTVRSVPNHLDRMLRYLIYALRITDDELDAKLRDINEKELRKTISMTPISVYGDPQHSISEAAARSRASAAKQTTIAAVAGDAPITVKHLEKIMRLLPGGDWSVSEMTCVFTRERYDGTIDTITINTREVAEYLDKVSRGEISEDAPVPLRMTTKVPDNI